MSRLFGHRALPSPAVFGIEFLLISGAVILAAIIRFSVGDLSIGKGVTYVPHACMTALVIQICMYYVDLYDFRVALNNRKLFIKLLQSLAVATIVLAVIFYVLPQLTVGRGIMLLGLPLAFGLIIGWRLIYQSVQTMQQFKMKILIVGTGEEARRLAGELLYTELPGYEVRGFIGEDDEIGKNVL